MKIPRIRSYTASKPRIARHKSKPGLTSDQVAAAKPPTSKPDVQRWESEGGHADHDPITSTTLSTAPVPAASPVTSTQTK